MAHVLGLEFLRNGVLAMSLSSMLLGLAGCDAQRLAELEEGAATEADLMARFGEPDSIWIVADMATPHSLGQQARGSKTLEYNR
jgi:hypothetical protein